MHLICTDESTAVEVTVTPGQAGGAPQFDGLFAAARARVPDADEVVADKGYDSWAIKDTVLEADMAAHIPSKSNAAEPWPIDEAAYKDRNRVERLVNKIKQFRAAATRYDKLAATFLATLKLVLALIKIRSIVNRTWHSGSTFPLPDVVHPIFVTDRYRPQVNAGVAGHFGFGHE